MTNFRRIASVLAVATLSAVSLPGCIIGDCEDGQDNCISLETGTTYTNSDSTSIAWAAGQGLVIDGFNGKIEIEDGAPTDQIVVEYKKSVVAETSDEGEAQAEARFDGDIQVNVTNDGTARVETARDSANGNPTVDLVVRLPANFDGAISIEQGNGTVDLDLRSFTPSAVTVRHDGAGDVDITGANGTLDIQGGFDVNVQMATWPTANSQILSDGQLGDVTVTLPSDASGTISVTGETVNLPAGLTDDGAGNITVGDGMGAALTVTGPKVVTLN